MIRLQSARPAFGMPRYLFTNAAKINNGVFVLDSATGRMDRLMEGSFRGLTRGPDGWFYVVSGYRRTAEDESTIHRFRLDKWQTEKVATFPVKDSHDLRWIDDSFYLVASVGNQILRLDAECREIDRMQIVEDEGDVCHVNCVAQLGGALYCSIFTLSPGERQEKRLTGSWHTEGKILRLDFPNKRFEIAYEPLSQPHTLVEEGGRVCLVESHTSTLSRVDLKTREKEWLGQYTGFLRGLTIGPSEALMGVSRMYKRDRRRMRPLPFLKQWEERLFPFAGILVVDPRTWKVRRRVPLEGAQIYDLCPLD
jgi:hypothetical protein